MKIDFSETAWRDYLYWQGQDKKTLKRINRLIQDISRNGYQCSGKPEQLKGDLSGWWSCKIDEKNRLVFRLLNDTIVEISQCRGHYGDK